MENLIQSASDRRRLFKTGASAPDPINPIVYGFTRPRRRRLHWVIAFVLVAGMGAMSLAGHYVAPEPSTEKRLDAGTTDGPAWGRGP